MKHIEQIKTEIEIMLGRRLNLLNGELLSSEELKEEVSGATNEILSFVDSLPEDKPFEDIEKEEKAFNSAWKDFIESLTDESGNIVTINSKCAARHFAEWQKEQMMKEAVDGEVCIIGSRVAYVEEKSNSALKQYILDNFKDGDKVKIILVKKN